MYAQVRGHRAYCATGGRSFAAARPTVLFLHGAGLDHGFWKLHTRHFTARGYSVLVPDLPGHSLSGGRPLADIESIADWLAELLETLGVEAVCFVGHSQGGLVGLEFSARYPQRLRSLSLVASGAATPVNPALLTAAQEDPERAIHLMIAWGFGPAGCDASGPAPGKAARAAARRVMRRNAPAALAADLAACDAYRGGLAAAATVSCPVQVITAEEDRMAPRRATDELIAALGAPEVCRIPASGHMIPVEAPDLCRQHLSRFVFEHHPA